MFHNAWKFGCSGCLITVFCNLQNLTMNHCPIHVRFFTAITSDVQVTIPGGHETLEASSLISWILMTKKSQPYILFFIHTYNDMWMLFLNLFRFFKLLSIWLSYKLHLFLPVCYIVHTNVTRDTDLHYDTQPGFQIHHLCPFINFNRMQITYTTTRAQMCTLLTLYQIWWTQQCWIYIIRKWNYKITSGMSLYVFEWEVWWFTTMYWMVCLIMQIKAASVVLVRSQHVLRWPTDLTASLI